MNGYPTISKQRVMMDKLQDIDKAMINIKQANPKPSPNDLNTLKKALNSFFKGCECKEVIYTVNTDKLFFGMCVIPVISNDDVKDILFSSDKKRITSYYIEIDSKLFDPMLGLSTKELTAVILHEVGHLTNNTEPVEEVRNAVNSYLVQNNEFLILSSASQYKQILAFGIKDSLKKITSLFDFNGNSEELLADEFVHTCGYGEELESALKKINKNSFKLNKQIKNKLLVLKWALRLYKNVGMQRIPAIHTLNRGKTITASKLQKRDMINLIRNIDQIDDDRLIIESVADVAHNLSTSITNMYKNIKKKGLRSLDEDFFDLSIRVKNCDEEQESLSILRSINVRLSILDDYLTTEQLDPETKKKVFGLMDKYNDLREILTKKSTYKSKYYGLFVQTPTITSRFDL